MQARKKPAKKSRICSPFTIFTSAAETVLHMEDLDSDHKARPDNDKNKNRITKVV